MSYFLRHYFDPDVDYLNLKPKTISEGEAADVYNLGYVQNAIRGQVLAEMVPMTRAQAELREGETLDERYIFESQDMPAGINTHVDEKFPQYLLADCNGYVFYNEGKITVKHLLNVRSDLNFKTGNIFFVGDMMIHGSVIAGFQAQANNIRVCNMVDGGRVRARGDLLVEAGARGGTGGHCRLIAGGKIRAPFVEKVEMRAEGPILIDKDCLYSEVYAGSTLAVRASMYGTTVNAYGNVYVEKQLGNKAAIPTKVYVGYSPTLIRELEKLDGRIDVVSQRLGHLTKIASHLLETSPSDPKAIKLKDTQTMYDHLREEREKLWAQLRCDEERALQCKIVVPGIVYPGVEISIGKAYMEISRQYENVCFQLSEEDIMVVPMGVAQK